MSRLQPPASTVPTRHWQRLPDGKVQCDVCPRRCQLAEGQRGLCFVRACQGGEVVLTTWGRSSGYCVDPIEKKPLNHFLPGTPVLSFGTAGCNLTCRFCQNWDISKSRELDTLLDEAPPERIARAALELGCRSVAYTYNDPVIFMEYAMDTARACRALGVRSVAVTAGYVQPAARRDFFAEMDAANVDLKGFTEHFYRKLATGHLKPVLDTLVWLKHASPVWFEITTLLIPGENDSPQEVRELSRWVRDELGPDVPLHFTAFHPDFRMTDTGPTPPETLRRSREIAREQGIHHVYTGNVHDVEGQSTWCAGCGALLIERDWYRLGAWNLTDDGRCRSCDARLPGVFDGPPGTWGPRRLPVRLADVAPRPAGEATSRP